MWRKPLYTFCSTKNIPVCISGNFISIENGTAFPKFPELRWQSYKLYPNFRNFHSGNFSSIWFYSRNFPEFLVKWFAVRKFNNFRIFWKLSQDFSVPLAFISKVPDFLVEWKPPLPSSKGSSKGPRLTNTSKRPGICLRKLC